MRRLNSLTLPANGGQGSLQSVMSFPTHRRMGTLVITGQVAVTCATTTTNLVTADALAILRHLFNAVTLSFGKTAPEVIDNALSFDELRALSYATAGRDFQFNGLALNSGPTGGIFNTQFVGTTNYRFTVYRPFFYERETGRRMFEGAPWKAQIEQMALTINRSSVFPTLTTNLSVAATACDLAIYADDLDAEAADGWAPCIRMHRDNTPGVKHRGPAGALYTLMEASAAGASTSLNLITLRRDGDSDLHNTVEAPELVRDASLRLPQGSADPNSLMTVIWQANESVQAGDLPVAPGYEFEQHGTTVALQTRWIYSPPVTDTYVAAYVAPNMATDQANIGAKLAQAPAVRGESVQGHAAAVSSVVALPPTHPKATTLDGLTLQRDGRTELSLSPMASAALKGASGKLAEQATKERLKAIPGGRPASRIQSAAMTFNAAQVARDSGLGRG